MGKRTKAVGELAIGVDVSDKNSKIAVVDANGVVVERAEVRTTDKGFRSYFEGRLPSRVAIEAGMHSPWLSRLLKSCGHDVVVANPRNVRLISESNSKNDKTDAELLAKLVRVDPDLLSPIEHRSKQAQVDLALIRARDALVSARTGLVNHVRGAVKSFGSRLPACSTEGFAIRVASEIPKELKPALWPLVCQIKSLTKEIRGYDKRIETACEHRYPVTRLLRQVPGVGPITSLCYVLTIHDPTRFKKSRAVGAYIGLRPRQNESGESSPELRITKAGSGELRRLLVQSAQRLLGVFGDECDLRDWGLELAARGGKRAKKVAVVAVARKLAVLLHRLWVTGEEYEPRRKQRKDEAA